MNLDAFSGVYLRKPYVDLAKGDLQVALMLTGITTESHPTHEQMLGNAAYKDGFRWLVMGHEDWGGYFLTKDQARRAIDVLKSMGVIKTQVFVFKDTPRLHIRIVKDVLLAKLEGRPILNTEEL